MRETRAKTLATRLALIRASAHFCFRTLPHIRWGPQPGDRDADPEGSLRPFRRNLVSCSFSLSPSVSVRSSSLIKVNFAHSSCFPSSCLPCLMSPSGALILSAPEKYLRFISFSSLICARVRSWRDKEMLGWHEEVRLPVLLMPLMI